MVKMGMMCLYGCRRISTWELWDMSSFLLILTAFSCLLLEQLLGLAVVCALINSYHADALCARHSDACRQCLSYFVLCDWGPVWQEVKQTKAGLPAPHSPAEGRHWPPDLAGPGFLTPITGHCTSLPPGVRATWKNSCQMIILVRDPPILCWWEYKLI